MGVVVVGRPGKVKEVKQPGTRLSRLVPGAQASCMQFLHVKNSTQSRNLASGFITSGPHALYLGRLLATGPGCPPSLVARSWSPMAWLHVP